MQKTFYTEGGCFAPQTSLKPRLAAIPTVYNDIRFRSRLEATWALFFDVAGVKWQYEPLDFDGYIPDFLISGSKDVFVEVKPETRYSELAKHHWKARGAGVNGLIVVGAFPFEVGDCNIRSPLKGSDHVIGSWCPSYSFQDEMWQVHKELWATGELDPSECPPPLPAPDYSGDPAWLFGGEDSECLCTYSEQIWFRDLALALSEPDGVYKCWSTAKNHLQWRRPK